MDVCALPFGFELFFPISTCEWPVLDLPACCCLYLWIVPVGFHASLDVLHLLSCQNLTQAHHIENAPHSHIQRPYEGGQTAKTDQSMLLNYQSVMASYNDFISRVS